MSNYTGNNYILSLAFYEGEVIFHLVHEKDSTCADTKMYNIMGSGCIYNEQSELLRYNHKYSLLKDPHYEAVANKTAFYTPCIIREYHNSYCQQRNEKNALIETVFWQYIKALFNQIFKSYEDLNYQISNLLHWALIVPDNWDNGFIDIVKKRLITIELAGLTDITIAKISDSVLSYIQIPHFKYSFVNGDYYIVCLFTEYDNATVYSYEIGPPIKGLDNIAHYTLKYSKSFSINYITEEYMLDTIFEGKKEEANKYNLDIKKLIDLCHGIYMQNNNPSVTMFHLIQENADGYLLGVKKSLLEEKEALLKSISLFSICQISKTSTKEGMINIEKIKKCIAKLARDHFNVKVVIASTAVLLSESSLSKIKIMLTPKLCKNVYQFDVFGQQPFVLGATHMVQNQLKIKNHLPRVLEKEKLEKITNGNILHINIKWDSNSVIFVNSKKEETIIEDTSKELFYGYTVKDCFEVKKHVHNFNMSYINMTQKLIWMLQLDDSRIDEVCYYIDYLNNLNSNKHEDEEQNSIREKNDSNNQKTEANKDSTFHNDENHFEENQIVNNEYKDQPEDIDSDSKIEKNLNETKNEDTKNEESTLEESQSLQNTMEDNKKSERLLPEQNNENLLELNQDTDQVIKSENNEDSNQFIHAKANEELKEENESIHEDNCEHLDKKKLTILDEIRLIEYYHCGEDLSATNWTLAQSMFRINQINIEPFFVMYLDIMLVYIREHLISLCALEKDDDYECYISIDYSILEVFIRIHDDSRRLLLNRHDSIQPHPGRTMKLLHLEQITAVHCKELVECFSSVENYLDYPQYMVQVQLNQSYIDLVLNAVLPIERNITSTEQETVITIKKKQIPFDIVDIIGEALWNYMQSLDDCPIHTCSDHTTADYNNNLDMYLGFKDYFNEYFTEQYSMNCGNGSMDWYNLVKVRMNRSCDCTYSIAPINIFDICIEPAIDQLTSTIYTSTVNPFVFGKYKASHIIIMESFMKLKCSNTYDQAFIRFKKKLNHEQKYYRHITIHWIKDDIFTILHKGMTSIAKNPLGGLLEQVASGSYFVAFDEKSRYYKNKWITLDENHSRVIIEEQSNIKDYFRDEGEFFIHFFDEDEVEAIILFRGNGEEHKACKMVKWMLFSKANKYPIIPKVIAGIHEITLTFHNDNEDSLMLKEEATSTFILNENTTLAPFI